MCELYGFSGKREKQLNRDILMLNTTWVYAMLQDKG